MPEQVYFYFRISKESAAALVQSLNNQHPELHAIDHTLDPERQHKINGKASKYITMNAEAVKNKLLPRIKQYLTEHAQSLHPKYQIKYTFEQTKAKLNSMLNLYGVDVSDMGCTVFSDTIFYLINRNLNMASIVSRFFNTHPKIKIPSPLTKITLAYLGSKELFEEKEEKVSPVVSSVIRGFSEDRNNTWSSSILIGDYKDQIDQVLKYFNKILPGSAKLSTEKLPFIDNGNGEFKVNKIQVATIAVNNNAFFSPQFECHFKDALNCYSQDVIELYQKDTDMISKTTQESIGELRKLHKIIPKQSEMEDFARSVTSLADHLYKFGLNESKRQADLVLDVTSKRRILKGVLTPDPERYDKFMLELNDPIKKILRELAPNNGFA